MMRSLYAGVSGLQNHQIRMDVLGNNIANVNTTGFKKERVDFEDMLYQMMSGAAKPTDEVGGINPKEIGLGMMVAATSTIHTQGAFQTTGVSTDLAISGNGFFMLKDGDKSFYTRAGAFGIDRDGTLVNPGTGMRVQGWMAEKVGTADILRTSATPTDLVIPVGSKDPARATGVVEYACNLSKETPEIPAGTTDAGTVKAGTWETDFTIYDAMGVKHSLRVSFAKEPGNPNVWRGTVLVDPENAAARTAVGLAGDPAAGGTNTFLVTFDATGKLRQVTDGAGNASATAGALSLRVGFDVSGAPANPDGTPTRQFFSLALGTVGSADRTITQFAGSSSTKAFAQDGNMMGYLESFKIDPSGVITGVYSSGTTKVIGQVAMASFTNPGGLEKAGTNTYMESNNSGLANIGASGTAGKGKILAGMLEMSNVDLSEQFTDMIVTQRGFQANSKTIQTADQMLQELLTLKR